MSQGFLLPRVLIVTLSFRAGRQEGPASTQRGASTGGARTLARLLTSEAASDVFRKKKILSHSVVSDFINPADYIIQSMEFSSHNN